MKYNSYTHIRFLLALQKDDVDDVKCMVEEGIHIIYENYPICRYSKSSSVIGSGLHQKQLPIDMAVRWGAFNVLKFLIDRGSDVRGAIGSLSYLVKKKIRKNKQKILDLLIKNGIDVNKSYSFYCPVGLSINCGDFETCEKLLKNGAIIGDWYGINRCPEMSPDILKKVNEIQMWIKIGGSLTIRRMYEIKEYDNSLNIFNHDVFNKILEFM